MSDDESKPMDDPVVGYVLADITRRAEEGKLHYGEYLHPHNGRVALWDAYEEAIDLVMYLRQCILEWDEHE